SPDNTPQANAGILPGANTIFGGDRINGNGRSGGRFTLGYWFGGCDVTCVESTTFFLGNSTQSGMFTSGGSPILARPFFNVLTNQQDAVLIAFPSIVSGTITPTSNSRVWGTEVNLRRALYADDCRRVDVLAGYRFVDLSEGLRVDTHTTSLDPQSPIP